jgi:inosine/xanthosine triphosphate pyrophosphatase family protein
MNRDNIPLILITTSSRKFDHLRYLSHHNDLPQNHDVVLAQVPWEYQEIQSDNMELLLSEAIQRDIFSNIQDCFFMIEQTSVFFDAMESKGPGQYFKKWWNTKSDEDLKMIFSRNPRATIESGLALNVPGHEPLVFTNTQKGKINMDGKIREENEKYSWLSSNDFNLYFVPDGATKVYNEMTVSEFLKYDFRKPNFDKICDRMGEYASIVKREITPDSIRNVVDANIDDIIYKDSGSFGGSTGDPKQSSLNDLERP